jgi:hypothetical protein
MMMMMMRRRRRRRRRSGDRDWPIIVEIQLRDGGGGFITITTLLTSNFPPCPPVATTIIILLIIVMAFRTRSERSRSACVRSGTTLWAWPRTADGSSSPGRSWATYDRCDKDII